MIAFFDDFALIIMMWGEYLVGLCFDFMFMIIFLFGFMEELIEILLGHEIGWWGLM